MQWKDDAELFTLIKKHLFSAIVGDVMDLQGLHHQFLPPQCRPLAPHMFVAGRAMPVLEADVFELQSPPFGKMLEALDDLQPNEVYVAAGCAPRYALWGELMATAAMKRGASGAVMAGFSRDTKGILEIDFPTFSYGPYALDQRGRGTVIDYRVPVAMNGVLIYTGSPDSEGSLGGLVRLATPELLEPIVMRTLEGAGWCGSDPVCLETEPSLAGERVSGAACHCCLLLPETACEKFNRELDRTMLVGDAAGGFEGFFGNGERDAWRS